MRATAAAGEMVRLGAPAVVTVCGMVGTETRITEVKVVDDGQVHGVKSEC